MRPVYLFKTPKTSVFEASAAPRAFDSSIRKGDATPPTRFRLRGQVWTHIQSPPGRQYYHMHPRHETLSPIHQGKQLEDAAQYHGP